MTFKQWMKQVDRTLEELIGFDSTHCRDRSWHDLYLDELTPKEAVEAEFTSGDFEAMMEEEIFG